MKKLAVLFVFFATLTFQANAIKRTISISGTAYSPAILTAFMGDTVTISGSAIHPLLQVSKATWMSNGTTAFPGGFGTTTKNYTFTVSSTDTIYYICTAHVSFGMKGRVVIAPASGIINLPAEAESVLVYPNPVTSTATVKLTSFGSNPVSVMVFSITGQLEKDLSSQLSDLNGARYVQFDAGFMPSGNHFVLVSDGRNKLVKRFEVIR